eukprot:g3806.t1
MFEHKSDPVHCKRSDSEALASPAASCVAMAVPAVTPTRKCKWAEVTGACSDREGDSLMSSLKSTTVGSFSCSGDHCRAGSGSYTPNSEGFRSDATTRAGATPSFVLGSVAEESSALAASGGSGGLEAGMMCDESTPAAAFEQAAAMEEVSGEHGCNDPNKMNSTVSQVIRTPPPVAPPALPPAAQLGRTTTTSVPLTPQPPQLPTALPTLTTAVSCPPTFVHDDHEARAQLNASIESIAASSPARERGGDHSLDPPAYSPLMSRTSTVWQYSNLDASLLSSVSSYPMSAAVPTIPAVHGQPASGNKFQTAPAPVVGRGVGGHQGQAQQPRKPNFIAQISEVRLGSWTSAHLGAAPALRARQALIGSENQAHMYYSLVPGTDHQRGAPPTSENNGSGNHSLAVAGGGAARNNCQEGVRVLTRWNNPFQAFVNTTLHVLRAERDSSKPDHKTHSELATHHLKIAGENGLVVMSQQICRVGLPAQAAEAGRRCQLVIAVGPAGTVVALWDDNPSARLEPNALLEAEVDLAPEMLNAMVPQNGPTHNGRKGTKGGASGGAAYGGVPAIAPSCATTTTGRGQNAATAEQAIRHAGDTTLGGEVVNNSELKVPGPLPTPTTCAEKGSRLHVFYRVVKTIQVQLIEGTNAIRITDATGTEIATPGWEVGLRVGHAIYLKETTYVTDLVMRSAARQPEDSDDQWRDFFSNVFATRDETEWANYTWDHASQQWVWIQDRYCEIMMEEWNRSAAIVQAANALSSTSSAGSSVRAVKLRWKRGPRAQQEHNRRKQIMYGKQIMYVHGGTSASSRYKVPPPPVPVKRMPGY